MTGLFGKGNEFAVGWHYNKRHMYYQKVSGRVFVAVSRLLYGYKAQLYRRGGMDVMGTCLLEIRTASKSKNGIDEMFQIGEIWLQLYFSGDENLIYKDNYHVYSAESVWGDDYDKNLFWI